MFGGRYRGTTLVTMDRIHSSDVDHAAPAILNHLGQKCLTGIERGM